MNIGKLKKVMLISLFVFATNLIYADDYFEGLVCEQDISTAGYLTPVYANLTPFVLYGKDNDRISFGKIESNLVNYVFGNDKFYGKAIAICGAENFTEVLRFLQNNYGHPITIPEQRTTMWMTEDHIFRVKRFSYHQGQVDVLCKNLFLKIEMSDE